MKAREFKLSVVILFMSIFVAKMAISIAPAFLCLDNKAVNAVIMQLEHESKTEKEDPEKDTFKEKKVFDENFMHFVAYRTFVVETNVLHNQENTLYAQVYHPIVPTPPPNA
ncbi:hypothetical protein [Mucilaginibacter psychrotolerans]|uniref:Uncharacterized protein n=1 Tax=Mucilaginibacter psychrotolerans TaxID=1524096 RepID=A0A4Y8SIM9_9SPHI|nr:hypothetical protein [Mucilaginibacter psychrotolerans]TFF38778.1 hypothetical protein E2R66_07165 [Mucilaginibacter psychrotolerans]